MSTSANSPLPTIIGRSSSSFTRVTRIFASELGVDHDLEVVRDLMSLEAGDYGGHPGLKLPSMRSARGTWFGALNVCRELQRLSPLGRRVVWPEALDEPVLANAQELVLHAMATAVTLILQTVGGGGDGAHPVKLQRSLLGTLGWLETNVADALGRLPPDRDLSYLEVTLFCLVSHLEFRELLLLTEYRALGAFREGFATRASALATPYRFDP